MNKNLFKTIFAAVLAALICVATMIIQIPMPLTNGYVNFGDCFILVAAWTLGGPWSFAAAGIGSALADLLTGYAHYVPGTLIIKALMAVVAVAIASGLGKKLPKIVGYVVGAIAAEAVMIVGYFFYAWLLLGKSAEGALSSVPGNAVQGAFGIICGLIMIAALDKTGVTSKVKKQVA